MANFYMGGICGMGMAPLAAFLSQDKNNVSGFDDCANIEIQHYLNSYKINSQLKVNSLEEFDTVVISTALKRRIDEFKKLGAKKILLRGQCWAEICAKRRLMAIMGSHGKSSVSALVAHSINKYNLDCGWLVGAIPVGFEMHKYCAENKMVVSEIDESDATIENFSPEITVALNADLDHTDTYANWDDLENMFIRLFERTQKFVIYPENDKIIKKVASKFPVKSIPVKISNDFNTTNKIMARTLVEKMFSIELPTDAFDDFKGIRRRQEYIFDNNKFSIIADYAHHPTEVKTFINAFKLQHSNKNKIVVFQPHRYTRTKQFADEFAQILDECAKDGTKVLLTPVYPASEVFDADGSSEKIAKKSKNGSIVLANCEEIIRMINTLKLNANNTVVAIIGAGDLYFDIKKFLEKENG